MDSANDPSLADPSVMDRKDRLAEALRACAWHEALRLAVELERLEPAEPLWPRRRANIQRRLANRRGEKDALQRAAELYASAGLVIQAIAACRELLSIDPMHSATQQRLEQLCSSPPSGSGRDIPAGARWAGGAGGAADPSDTAPLEELELTEMIPGAVPSCIGTASLEGVSEIPLDGQDAHMASDLQLAPAPPELPSAARTLRETPLFGSLSGDALRALIERVRVIEIAEAEVLFRQGDRADTLYVVVDGAVVPLAESADSGEPTRLAVLEPGDFFGEAGLVTRQPRNATIRALVDTKLLAIDRRVMWQLVRRHPETLRVMLRFLRERLIGRLVRTSPLFRAFEPADRAAVTRHFDLLEVRDAQIVIEQGAPTPALFVVLAGHLDIAVVEADGDKILARLGPGDICGERSLLRGEPAMAGVISSGKCWLLALPEARFRGILARNPELGNLIEEILETRERENRDSFSWPPPVAGGNVGLV